MASDPWSGTLGGFALKAVFPARNHCPLNGFEQITYDEYIQDLAQA